MSRFWTRRRRAAALALALDALAVPIALAAARTLAGVLPGASAAELEAQEALAFAARASALVIPLHLAALYAFDLHGVTPRGASARHRRRLVPLSAAAIASVPLLAEDRIEVAALLAHVPLLLGLSLASRAVLRRWVGSWRARRLAAIGSRARVQGLVAALSGEASSEYALGPILDVAPAGGTQPAQAEAAEELLRNGGFAAVAIDTGLVLSGEAVARLIDLRLAGVEVWDLSTLEAELTGCVPEHAVDARRIARALLPGGRAPRRFRPGAKRACDVVGASLGLLVAAPVMALIALAVRLESEGPALFAQERLGRRRRPFVCLKFRTMVQDAERLSGPRWASEDDPRITRVGRVLRKLRLDELPQLVNVLRGDMSLVGPRPIRAHFADRLTKSIPFYEARFSATPGLTGWAQVRQGYSGSELEQAQKFRHDLYYLENASLALDAYVVLKTVQTVVTRPGV